MILLCTAVSVAASIVSTPPADPEHRRARRIKIRALNTRPAGWRVVDFRRGGVSRISEAMRDGEGRRGALQQILPGPDAIDATAEIEILSRDTEHDPLSGLRPTRGGFGLVASLREMSFSFYRDASSTTYPWLGAALRIYVFDPDLGPHGTSYAMVWEPIYNGYGLELPTDTWHRADVVQGLLWRHPLYIDGAQAPRDFCARNLSECYIYDRTIFDWALGPRAVVFGFSLSAGGGWGGSYSGYVDDVIVAFEDGRRRHWDFHAPPPCPGRHRDRGHDDD